MLLTLLAGAAPRKSVTAALDDPAFFELWWQWAGEGRMVWLLLALVVMMILLRTAPVSRRAQPAAKVRLPITLVALHIVTLTCAAIVKVAGYSPETWLVAAFAFELFAVVAIVSIAAFRAILPRVGLELPRILIDIITGATVIIAMIAIGKRAGFSVAGLITTSAVLTAVVGFALQDTLGNMMGGIALQLDRSINVGDWIVLGTGMPPGRVTEIRWRYTAIETQSWTTIIIPNSMLMKGQVTVLGRRQGAPVLLRRDVDFHVDFATAPGVVIDVVRRALLANPVARMASDPPVQVLYFGVRESINIYKVRYWLNDLAVDDPTDAEVRHRVFYALGRAGLSFSIPAQTVLLTSQDAAHAQRRDDAELSRRLAALARVDLLAMLGDDERGRLATRLEYAPFGRGEAMTREGALDDGLYMIVSGEASVQIGADGLEVARLQAGQFFGEMSLMTGEKRSATVVAMTDVVTYRLDKEAFEELMRSRPEISETVAEILAERRMRLDAARDQMDDGARSRKRQSTKQDILGRIRGFFNVGDWR